MEYLFEPPTINAEGFVIAKGIKRDKAILPFKVGDEVEVISEGKCQGLKGKITKICSNNTEDGEYFQYQIDGCKVFVAGALRKIEYAECNVNSRGTPALQYNLFKIQEEKSMTEITKTPATQKIVDMWYEKSKAKIDDIYEKERVKIIAEDTVKRAFDEKVEELKEWFKELVPDEKDQMLYVTNAIYGPSGTMITGFENGWKNCLLKTETSKKLEVVEKEKNGKLSSLDRLKEEIETMLSGCGRTDDEWEVLVAYGICDIHRHLTVEGDAV